MQLPTNVTFEGATLSLRSETTLSLYFKGLPEDTEFTCVGKIRSILLGVLCAVCLQVPLNVCAVDLPIVPVEESQAETTTAASETPAVTQKPAEQETPVIPEVPATSKTAETTRASASVKSTTRSDATISDLPASENTDSEINELPVLSPDGESTAEISESSSESSLSGEKDSSDTQITANTDSKDITEARKAFCP